MDRREYKTVALPQLMDGRRRRGQSKAEMIGDIVSGVINQQARAGWRYVGADAYRTMERASLIGGKRETVYTVLIFEKTVPVDGRIEPSLGDDAAIDAPTARGRRDAEPDPFPADLERADRRAEPPRVDLEAARARAAPRGNGVRPDATRPEPSPAARSAQARGVAARLEPNSRATPRAPRSDERERGADRFTAHEIDPKSPEPTRRSVEPGFDDAFDAGFDARGGGRGGERRPPSRASGAKDAGDRTFIDDLGPFEDEFDPTGGRSGDADRKSGPTHRGRRTRS